jgi:hypothetical protein
METLKLGTRCECCAEECPNERCHIFSQDDANAGITNQLVAVRLVTVLEGKSLDGTPMFGKRAYCAACAEYHEGVTK